ncbi:UNKNOWN [Stylonychia lemnae]|uniref:Uncharacterized protein n=1 Tax=Stylonychia lemnae TaxID=5949 RepID=A0A077ZWX1_STYLE|nr:UNKNOWN [Stylonychia lemnae]|eukprot:CDW74096.1 UNKNOWN [Stylonychia lemnae]
MKSIATAALVLLGFVSSQQITRPIHELTKKPVHEKNEISQANWPTVKFYKDYIASGDLMKYNSQTKTLESLHGSSVFAQVDNTNDRMIQDFSGDMSGLGLGEMVIYIDAKQHALYQKFVQANQCHKMDLPEGFSLSETYKHAFDPAYNITSYNGVESLEWENNANQYHAFHVNMGVGQSETYYFDVKSTELIWTVRDDKQLIIHTPKGVQQKTFKDSDFVLPVCKGTSEEYMAFLE